MERVLGRGTFGTVILRDGMAVKKFNKLKHLLQEYTALVYLSDCQYVVKSMGANISNNELYMELYDCNFASWQNYKWNPRKYNTKFKGPVGMGPSIEEINLVIRHILYGLIELHDRDLAHGDLKPNNILLKLDREGSVVKAVLGDCGFVSIDKYARVENTADTYRDPTTHHHSCHDIFSLGICMLELFGKVRIRKQNSYAELSKIITDRITDPKQAQLLHLMLGEDGPSRPSARHILRYLFNETVPYWTYQPLGPSGDDPKHIPFVKNLMKNVTAKYKIGRGNKGYSAVLRHIRFYNVNPKDYEIYCYATLIILSSLFRCKGFNIDIYNRMYPDVDDTLIFSKIDKLLSDPDFIKIIMSPRS